MQKHQLTLCYLCSVSKEQRLLYFCPAFAFCSAWAGKKHWQSRESFTELRCFAEGMGCLDKIRFSVPAGIHTL